VIKNLFGFFVIIYIRRLFWELNSTTLSCLHFRKLGKALKKYCWLMRHIEVLIIMVGKFC